MEEQERSKEHADSVEFGAMERREGDLRSGDEGY
jgi:hypothetical protein